MEDITPEQFLKAVFPDLYTSPNEVLYTYMTRDGGWRNKYVRRHRRRIPVGTLSTYFCVSTTDQCADYPRRGYRNVREAYVVVCDDVGTKAAEPPVAPSYIIETSEGNYQWGYFIEPFDVSTREGQHQYDTVLYSLVQAGLNDPGCRNATRVVRLPGSLHKSGFVACVVAWNPDRHWDVEELLPAMNVEVVEPANRSVVDAAPGKYTQLADVTDEVYHWLVAQGLVIGHGNNWVYLNCPWREEHTNQAQGDTSTAYSPENYGQFAPPAFRCLHGHCEGRDTAHFKQWLRKQGCPAVWGDEDIDAAAAVLAAFTENNHA